jgi:hypothetical protein
MADQQASQGYRSGDKNSKDGKKTLVPEENEHKSDSKEEIGNVFTLLLLCKFKLIHLYPIDLTDPEVEAAAAKIQSAFKMRGRRNININYA